MIPMDGSDMPKEDVALFVEGARRGILSIHFALKE